MSVKRRKRPSQATGPLGKTLRSSRVFVLDLLWLDVTLGLLIELLLTVLSAKAIFLAFEGTRCRRLVRIYLHTANGVFRHRSSPFLGN